MTDAMQELGPVSEATVVETARITPTDRDEVRRIRLRVDDPAFRFAAGQSVGVVVPGPHDMGNRYHMRRYSIASANGRAATDAIEFDLLVRRCFYLDEFSGERFPGSHPTICVTSAPDSASRSPAPSDRRSTSRSATPPTWS